MDQGGRDEEPGAEPLRYERERRERAERRNRISWRIVAWFCAGALGLLAYDSATAARDAQQTGRPWLYPAGVSVLSALGLVALIAWAVRRRS